MELGGWHIGAREYGGALDGQMPARLEQRDECVAYRLFS